eukprot:TRINITY_DN61999_c0_g1_i1.p1 TRINITY_DN61999_c0_g1~~TRINITY_DN61999_c0_g1_i1.p1  ORF type:complete len:733 (+),score=119.87 TRINITY_DN61999_c0_g1_i1:81-2279(+)
MAAADQQQPELSQKELLQQFYSSGATNFKAFMDKKTKTKAQAKQERKTAATVPIAPAVVSPADGSVAPTEPASETKKKKVAPAPAPTPTEPKDTAEPVRRPISPPGSGAPLPAKQEFNSTTQSNLSGSHTFHAAPGDAASNEYMAFLKQQQDLQKCHQKLQEVIGAFERDRREHQADLGKVRGQANELLGDLEEGTNWNLSSKYNINTLIKDAKLKLYPQQLYQHDTKPQYLDIVQQGGNLQKLRDDHGNRETYAPFKSLFDHGKRRLERIEKELRNSQLDATEMSRLPDALFVQLDHVLGSPTIHEVLQNNEETLEDLLFKLEDTKGKRAEALQDGEMMLAEKHFYDVVQFYENILEIVLEKLGTTEEIRKKAQVFDKVREQYQSKAAAEADKLRKQKEQLKGQCEADLKRIFSLKEHVDGVEVSTAKKLAEEKRQSDAFLSDNAAKIDAVWAKMEDLEKELEQLEADRSKEVKKRIHAKDNDEHRRMEYEKFCTVVDKHCQLLDLTISNCDTFIYSTTLLSEFVNTGFNTLGGNLGKQDQDHGDLLLETHRQHLEMFRGLYLALGELVHKKEKKIEEIDYRIKTSHIQQELAMETFNPQAKAFSDSKKALLRERDDVENEVQELKEKAEFALKNFKISEEALHDAGIEFVHPVVEQQEEELETKAKMVEYKAISVGHVDAIPIQAELRSIKQQMAETKKVVDSVNASAMSSTLPTIKRTGSPAHTAALLQ